jgi:hypothetical protein
MSVFASASAAAASVSEEEEPTKAQDFVSDGWLWAKSLELNRTPLKRSLVLPQIVSKDKSRALKIINYSDLYDTLVTTNVSRPNLRARAERLLTHPKDIASGDTFQTTDCRGVGTYYAIYLLEDVFVNHPLLRDVSAMSFHADDDKIPEEQDDSKLLKNSPIYLNQYVDLQRNLFPILDNEELMEEVQSALNQSWKAEDNLISLGPILNKPQFSTLWADIELFLRYNANVPGIRDLMQNNVEVRLQFHRGRYYSEQLRSYIGKFATIGLPPARCSIESVSKNINDTFYFKEDDEEEYSSLFSRDHVEALGTVDPQPLWASFLSRTNFAGKYGSKLTTTTQPKWQVYLISHMDEMGYNAPTMFSWAPYGYFGYEGIQYRDVDLQLLQPPLDQRTVLGRILHFSARKRLQNSRSARKVGEDDDKGDEDEEDDEKSADKRNKVALYEKCRYFPYKRDFVIVEDSELRWFSTLGVWELECGEFGDERMQWHHEISPTDVIPEHHCLSMRSIYLQPRVMLKRHAQLLRDQLLKLQINSASSPGASIDVTSEAELDNLMSAYWASV